MATQREDVALVKNESVPTYTESNDGENQTYTVDEAMRKIGLGWYHAKRFPVIGLSAFTQSSMVALPTIIMVNLQCTWDLTTFHEVMVLFALFLGNIPGDIFSGILSDRKGRKVCLLLGQWLLLAATVLSVVSTGYFIFILFYLLIGGAIGMLTFVVVVQLSEISPPKYRSSAITVFYICWALGALYTTTAGYFVLNANGWIVTTIVVAIPNLIICVLMCFIDESPKYLCISGQIQEAEALLQYMADQNGSTLPKGRLQAEEEPKRGSIKEICHPHLRRTLFILCLAFFSSGVIIYASYSMVPFIVEEGYCANRESASGNETVTDQCQFSDQTLKETALVTTAEVIMIPIFAVMCELLGRIPTARFLSAVSLVSSFMMVFCMGNFMMMASLYIQRGAVQSLFLILYIYTPECFPTYIRGSACGVILMAMTSGGLVSSMLVYPVGVQHSFRYLMIILSCCSLASLIATWLLQTETQGTDLSDNRTTASEEKQ